MNDGKMGQVLLVSDLASRTGLSIHTLNYYIKLGLISEQARAERSGYRLFDEETVITLKVIMALRRRQVPLKEIMARKRHGLL